MRSLRYSLLFMLCALILAANLPVQAQSDELPVSTQIDYEYGSQITFSASIDLDQEVTRAFLYIRSSSTGETRFIETSITFQEDMTILSATHDLRGSWIDPFDLISFWWQLELENGLNVTTELDQFRYIDNRFEWTVVSDEILEVYWVGGDAQIGEQLLLLANESLASLLNSYDFAPPAQIAVFIYPSSGDLQSAIQLSGASWVGANSIPDRSVIFLVVQNSDETMIDLERDLPHELTHILLYDRMGENYKNLPAWLSEGLSTLQERQPNPAYRFELETAHTNNTLLSLESLCASFPMADSDALLAYAQSASFTQYLLDIYGTGGIHSLMDAYQEGVSCTGGVQRVYQRSLSQLESEWKLYHLPGISGIARLRAILPWGLILLLVVIMLVIGMFTKKRRSENG